MMPTILSVGGVNAITIEVKDYAVENRDAVVEFARTITSVSCQAEAQAAADTIKELRGIAKSVEDSRVEVKKPILDLGRKIDSVAAAFVTDVSKERDRLSRLLTTFEVEQNRIRLEAERRRQEEIQAAMTREAAERKAAEETRQKAEAEAAALAKAAEAEQNPFALAEAEARAREAAVNEAKQKSDSAKAAADAVAKATIATAAAVAPSKIEGTQVRVTPNFEVEDPLLLATTCPHLVTITPKRVEILAVMRSRPPWEGKQQCMAGVVGWWERKVIA